jgi:CDP-glucose 4,6-dehydratase
MSMHANCSDENLWLSADNTHRFWKGKRVFLTGHTGFKGAWLSLWLQAMGAEVIGYALAAPATSPSLYELADIGRDMKSIIGDIRHLDTVQASMAEARPDIVFHLAAQALVRESYASPVETYATNVMGTVYLLEAARQTPSVRVIVNITTDKCYENREWVWGYRENDRLGGDDPYANSKACAELVSKAYRTSFLVENGVGLATARAGNVIGGGDWAKNRLIPDILQAFIEGRQVQIRHPNAIRPWQHVLESLSGYLLLAQMLWDNPAAYSESWNFGPDNNDAWPVHRIVDGMAALWGNNVGWTLDDNRHPHESSVLRLDCSKARTQLGWIPRLTIENSLRWVVEWAQAYQIEPSKKNLRELTLAQIKRFEKMSFIYYSGG